MNRFFLSSNQINTTSFSDCSGNLTCALQATPVGYFSNDLFRSRWYR